MKSTPEDRFERQFFETRLDLVGARWWHEAALTAPGPEMPRRSAMEVLVALAAAGVWGIASLLNEARDGHDHGDGLVAEPLVPARELQTANGWDTGATGQPLAFPGQQTAAIDGQPAQLAGLAQALAPRQARWRPWFVPTLMQDAELPIHASLSTTLRPMVSPAMIDAARCVAGLGQPGPGRAGDLLLVLDLPGPEAVAAAAALATHREPVFVLDNLPHPLGVVPAHQTLGALLWHRPAFEAAAAGRAADAPGMLVLDANRLAPYANEPDRFDNRWLAQLPPAAELGKLGVTTVLYVVTWGQRVELDDVNATLLAWHGAGLELHLLGLDELVAGLVTEAPQPTPLYQSGANVQVELERRPVLRGRMQPAIRRNDFTNRWSQFGQTRSSRWLPVGHPRRFTGHRTGGSSRRGGTFGG